MATNPYTKFLCALHAPNSRGEIRAQKAGVGSLISEPAHSCEPEIDGGGSVTSLFERDPVPGDYSFVEREPRFGAVPFDEFANGVIVGALRASGRSGY